MKWVLIIIGILFAFLITIVVMHEIKYKCVSGHYEDRLEYDVVFKMPMVHRVFVCDEEMLREEYNKLNKKCNCK